MDAMLKEIVSIIREREAIPASRVEVAKEAGIPLSTLWRIETGESIPRLNTLSTIRAALKRLKARKVRATSSIAA